MICSLSTNFWFDSIFSWFSYSLAQAPDSSLPRSSTLSARSYLRAFADAGPLPFFWSLFQCDITKKDFLNNLFKRMLHHIAFPPRFSIALIPLLRLISLTLNIWCVSLYFLSPTVTWHPKRHSFLFYSLSQPQCLWMSDTKHVASKCPSFKIPPKEETYVLGRRSATYRTFQIQNNLTFGDWFYVL